MKKYRHHIIVSIAIAISISIITSCTKDDSTVQGPSEQFDIPELLMRNEAVVNTIEWESRVNQVSMRAALR